MQYSKRNGRKGVMNENKEPGVEEVNDPEVFEQEPPAS